MDLPKNACIYCRLSYAPDGSLEKVERQEADCRDLGDRINWGVCCVYSDNSKSAWQKNRKRADWDAMLESLKPGAVCPNGNHHDGILAYHGDRLMRQPWDLELLLKVSEDQHVPLASPQGTRNLSSEDDRFILRIEVAQACKASADTSRRVKRGYKARAEKGNPTAGPHRLFGYGVPTGRVGRTGKPIYDLTKQVRTEARVGRESVKKFLAGQSQGGVIEWMNTKSTTTTGRVWKANAFRFWVRNPHIAGLILHEGTLYPGNWKGILTRQQWEDANAILDQNSEDYGYHGRTRVHLLSGGVVSCGSCGGPFYTKPSGTGGRYREYYCRNPQCPRPTTRNVRNLDEYMIGHALRVLNDPRFLVAIHPDHTGSHVGAEIASLERRKAKDVKVLEDLANHPEVDIAGLVTGLASYDRKIQQLRNQLKSSSHQKLHARMAGITRVQWDAEPVDVRAETIRSLFTVKVLPTGRTGRGFDPSFVEVARRNAL